VVNNNNENNSINNSPSGNIYLVHNAWMLCIDMYLTKTDNIISSGH
jgi:hypothetical protein